MKSVLLDYSKYVLLTIFVISRILIVRAQGSAEEKDDLVPSKDVDSVCQVMRKLDEDLTKVCTDPPVDGGAEMMKMLNTYNQAASHLLRHCKSDEVKAFSIAKDMLERGGPEFLDVDLDENQIEQNFSWDKEDLEKMHEARKKTNIVWFDIWRLYNKIPLEY